jgi:predicted small metal-binding protein
MRQGFSKAAPRGRADHSSPQEATAMVKKMVKCDCGFTVSSEDENRLVADLQKHAKEHHKMNLSRDQVLAMAQPDPSGSPGAKRKA